MCEMLLFGTTWMELDIMMLSVISQVQKHSISCPQSYVKSKNADLIKIESSLEVTRGQEEYGVWAKV
jgi:hypothetical protein